MTEEQWLDSADGKTIDEVIALEDDYRIDSIVLAIENALLERTEWSPTERIVLAIEAMEREVGNGGFNQFFYNSSNEFAAELPAALRAVGIPEIAVLAERAWQAIGAQPDWTHDDFEEAAADPAEAIMDELNDCDSAYYETEDNIAGRLFEYIKIHRNDIQLSVEE